ncbi:MAG TPA: Crp/Fnr family transcriptional regulator [Flavisolibacter sp.]
MFQFLQQKITEKTTLTEDELAYCKHVFLPKKLRRRQYFLQEGDVCRYQAFVVKGILRSYTIDEKGAEHVLQFAPEGWWIADLYSYLTDEPSTFTIDALEEVELLVITRPAWEELMLKVPKLEHYFRVLVQNHLIATQRRLLQTLTQTAEEKYVKFADAYPACIQRVPQHMIASYLGISRETLSRLRKQMAIRK